MNVLKKGFTLIELLVVIVILGILAAISVGTYQRFFGKANDAQVVSLVSVLSLEAQTAGIVPGFDSSNIDATTVTAWLTDNGIDASKMSLACPIYIGVTGSGTTYQWYVAGTGESSSTDNAGAAGPIYENSVGYIPTEISGYTGTACMTIATPGVISITDTDAVFTVTAVAATP